MEKINEKRLVVLKVALELLKIEQEKSKESKIIQKSNENKNIDLSSGDFKYLEVGELLQRDDSKITGITYVINHLKRPFESTSFPEELEELKKENINIALDKISKILETDDFKIVSNFTDFTRVLWVLRKENIGG